MAATDTSSIPFWGESPEVWDSVSLGGVEIPGLCRVAGTGMRLRKKSSRAAGNDGASVSMLGLDVVSFSIEVKLWTQAHLEAFQEIIRLAKPRKKAVKKTETKTETVVVGRDEYSVMKIVDGYPQLTREGVDKTETRTKTVSKTVGYDLVPLSVSHPALELFGISECVVESVSLPVERSPGLWTSTIQCTEFSASRSRGVSRPTGGVGILDGIGSAIDSPRPSKTNAGTRT